MGPPCGDAADTQSQPDCRALAEILSPRVRDPGPAGRARRRTGFAGAAASWVAVDADRCLLIRRAFGEPARRFALHQQRRKGIARADLGRRLAAQGADRDMRCQALDRARRADRRSPDRESDRRAPARPAGVIRHGDDGGAGLHVRQQHDVDQRRRHHPGALRPGIVADACRGRSFLRKLPAARDSRAEPARPDGTRRARPQ